jgi:HAD superfamily hydrolase (TIGR01484 family)
VKIVNKIKIIFTDLDGTILPHNCSVSVTDFETFNLLEKNDIIKVIATGRTLNSLKSAISLDFPIDYAIFSSGSGIIHWQTQTIIKDYSLYQDEINKISQTLFNLEQNFLIYDPIPQNHYFQYYQSCNLIPDFERYLNKNKLFSRPFNIKNINQSATQLLTMVESLKTFNYLQELLQKINIKIVRATSPMDHKTIWMEFFHPEVSKGNAAYFLCEKLGINPIYSLGIGNDFNDIDLLNFTHHSYVVENAPLELKQKYKTTAHVKNNGFSQIVRKLI